jgi:folate-binding protein YgfZ
MQSIIINQRTYYAQLSLDKELAFSKQTNYLFDINYLRLIHVKGTKAREFLQGQFTCDVNKVSSHLIQPGAFCNTKGRILALFYILQLEDELCLVLPQDLVDDTVNSLHKAAQFSGVTFEEDSTVSFMGILNNIEVPATYSLPKEKFEILHQENPIISLGNNTYLALLREKTEIRFIKQFGDAVELRGSIAWHYLRLLDSECQIYPNSRGVFLPHRLDLQDTAYISFSKGCYRGQEIIARTQYKAKRKHGLKIFTVNVFKGFTPGQRIYNQEGSEIGELVDFAPLSNNTTLIALSILLDHPLQVIFEGSEEINTLS